MKKKIISFLALFIILFFSCSNVFAAENKIPNDKAILALVEKNICEINLNDMGTFKREVTNFDADKKEITLTLTVTNTMQEEEYSKPIELFLVLDNSSSMNNTYENKQKLEYVSETAKAFVNSLFSHFTNLKVGIVSFSSIDPVTSTESLGTINDATLLLNLSNSKENVLNAITTYTETQGFYTNIEAGLSLAQSNFTTSTDSEKYVVLLSDGIPNLSLDTKNTLTYSGANATNTKKKLQDMKDAGYHIYSVLMGSDESNLENPNAPLLDGTNTHMTYLQLAEEIFGTKTAPTAGSFYYINYDSLATTINSDIYNHITAVKDNSMKNIVVKDYLAQEIIDNFNFEYVGEPNIGTKSENVDTTNNSITWNIDVLNPGEIATLVYKLTLKNEFDVDIANKVLPTNPKVDIDFKTVDGEESISSDVTPKVKLTYEKPADNTTSKDPIPQTGVYNNLIIVVLACVIVFAVFRLVSYRKIK